MQTITIASEAVSIPIIVAPQLNLIVDPCEQCGAESDYGVHGIKDGEASSRYYCHKCYHKIKRNRDE
jgi:hypothetical protein